MTIENTKSLAFIVKMARHDAGFEDFSVAGMYSKVFSSNMLASMTERVHALFSDTSSRSNGVTIPAISRKITEFMSATPYADMAVIKIYAPKGLKVTYLEYLAALESVLPYVLRIKGDLVLPTQVYLSTLINTPEILESIAGPTAHTHPNVMPKLPASPDELAKQIGKCFDAHAVTDEQPYGQLLKRNSDLDTVIARTKALSDAITNAQIKELEQSVQDVIELASRLVESVRNDPRYRGSSAVVNHAIYDRIYSCAIWVEFFAVYVRQVLVLKTAIADSIKKIDSIAKR